MSTVHYAPGSFDNHTQQIIDEETESKDAWVQRIIAIIKRNPIRYINSADLGDIISSERSTLESDIPTVPANNTSRPGVSA